MISMHRPMYVSSHLHHDIATAERHGIETGTLPLLVRGSPRPISSCGSAASTKAAASGNSVQLEACGCCHPTGAASADG